MKINLSQMLWLGAGVAVIALLGFFVIWPAIERSNDVSDVVLAARLNDIDVDSQEVGSWFDALDKCLSERQSKHAIVEYLNMNNANLPLVKSLVLMTCPYSDLERLKHGNE